MDLFRKSLAERAAAIGRHHRDTADAGVLHAALEPLRNELLGVRGHGDTSKLIRDSAAAAAAFGDDHNFSVWGAARHAEKVALIQRQREWEAKLEAAAAVKRAAVTAERPKVFAALRRLGFKREHTSGVSAYYRKGVMMVRVSDHEVPLTAERDYNLQNGGRSWANSRWSFVIGENNLEDWLEDVRDFLKAK